MAVLYVDEAGEEGFKETSSEWFILGGALHANSGLRSCVKCYDTFKAARRNEGWFFHFQKRSHDERVAFIHAIREAPYQGMAVMIHKPSINQPERFKQRYWLYFYALKFLLERATQWADTTAHETIHLMLSSRRGLDKGKLKAYFDRIKSSPFVKRDEILWSVFQHDEIHIEPNRRFRGLQVADCIASAIFKAVEISEYGTLESRYVTDLLPIFARHPYRGFQAVSCWPSPPFSLYQQRMAWKDVGLGQAAQ